MGYQGKPENDNPDDGTPEYLIVTTFYATILLKNRNVRHGYLAADHWFYILERIYFKNIKLKKKKKKSQTHKLK